MCPGNCSNSNDKDGNQATKAKHTLGSRRMSLLAATKSNKLCPHVRQHPQTWTTMALCTHIVSYFTYVIQSMSSLQRPARHMKQLSATHQPNRQLHATHLPQPTYLLLDSPPPTFCNALRSTCLHAASSSSARVSSSRRKLLQPPLVTPVALPQVGRTGGSTMLLAPSCQQQQHSAAAPRPPTPTPPHASIHL